MVFLHGPQPPSKAFLRNRYGESWEVKIANYQNTDMFWFEDGWRKFVEENKPAYGDHIVFKFDGKSTFDFKLFDEYDDEKEYLRIPKSEPVEDMELEQVVPEPEERQNMHRQPVEPLPESEVRLLQPEAEEQGNMHPESQERQLQLAPGLTPPESEYSASDGEYWSDEDIEFDDENTISGRKTAGGRRVPTITIEDEEAFFRSGFPRPNNPYFVTKRTSKRIQLYLPTEVVKDFNLTFPEQIVIRDEKNQEWTGKVRKWKDGRLWISKGWKSYCRWNNMQKDDFCIIEIVRPETPEAKMFLKAHLVPAAALIAATSS